MIDPFLPIAFLTAGLLGSGHCIGMCGGIVAALSLSPKGRRGGISFYLFYGIGRIITYTLIGFAVGWLGSAIAYTDLFRTAARLLLVGSDLFVILLGLGTAGAFARLNVMRLEFSGSMRALTEAVGRLRLLPPALAAFPLGMLFGLLPCGYFYAMAIAAAQSANPAIGALALFAFGLGTLPALLLFGGTAGWIGNRARQWMLSGAGVMVALMGSYNLLSHLRMMGY